MMRILGNLIGLIVAVAVIGFFSAPYVGSSASAPRRMRGIRPGWRS